MKKIITFVVVLFMIGMVNTGFCQMKQGAVEISPFIGGFHYEGNQDFNKHVIYGARLGYAFTDNFSGELVGSLGKTYYTEFEPNVRMHTYNVRLEGLYHFMPASRFVPFVAMGFGGQRNDPFERSNDDKWRLVGDYGAGVKFFFTEHIALRADVRHILASGSIYNNLEYTLGLSFLFGGEKPAPVPVAAPVAVPPPPPPEPLAAPIGLAAVAKSVSDIDLDWNCVKDATGYKVYRGGDYAFATSGGLATDKDLKAETTYCYKVVATDDKGRESALSNQILCPDHATACAGGEKTRRICRRKSHHREGQGNHRH